MARVFTKFQAKLRSALSMAMVACMVLPTLVFGAGLAAASPEESDDTPVLAIATFAAASLVPSDAQLSSIGLEARYRFASIPAVTVSGPRDAVELLRGDPALVGIEYDRPLEYFLDTATFSTKAADVWGSTWWPVESQVGREDPSPLVVDGAPVDGRGIVVGIVDSGVDATHPDLWWAPAAVEGGPLAPKVLACVLLPTMTSPELDAPNCDPASGHGTHVAGIVAGTGWAVRNGLTPLQPATTPYVGAAPGAQLAVAAAGAGISIVYATQGLDWMYQNADAMGIRVVTNSWGDAPGCSASAPNNTITQITDKLVNEKGITVLFSAGNYDTISTSPIPTWTSTYSRNPTPGVISVANYNEFGAGTRDGDVSNLSSDGCVGVGQDYPHTWPDVAAPGTSIASTAAKTGATIPPTWDPGFYGSASGTSMAAPHVAGIVAMMYQANPDITPAQVERILIQSSTPWADGVTARAIAGTVPHWGPTLQNNAVAGFASPELCRISPQIAAQLEAGDPAVDLLFPGFRTLVSSRGLDADNWVCRDFKRGAGLVDAYAAVQAAIALRDDDVDPEGTPEIGITQPAENAQVAAGALTVTGLVDRMGDGANEPPAATLAASPQGGPAPLDVTFSLAASDADGAISAYTLDFGDGEPQSGTTVPASATHTYAANGAYTATLTVVDNEGASAESSVSISVGGLPQTNPDITGETYAYNFPTDVAGIVSASPGISNVLALAVGQATGDAVPKYPAGTEVSIQSRSVGSVDANVPVTLDSLAELVILDAAGVVVAGPLDATAFDDTDALGNPGVGFDAGELTIPVDWSGRYYLALRILHGGATHYITSPAFDGLKPIDVIGADGEGVPELPGSGDGSDEGHSIADADHDGSTPMGEIHWADVSVDADSVTAVIQIGLVPPAPEGGSPTLYAFTINNVEFESFLYGVGFGPRVYDQDRSVQPEGASTTWDRTNNRIVIDIPRAYLASLGADCPCTGHVEAQAGAPFTGSLDAHTTLDRAPDAGSVDLRAAWQAPSLPKNLVPGVQYGSQSDPENSDAEDDTLSFAVAGTMTPPVPVAHLDVTKAWVSREGADDFDLTLKVKDMAAKPPSADFLVGRVATNYGTEFCVDNVAQTYNSGVTGVTCYRLSAIDGALGPVFSGGVVQKDGSGSCAVSGIVAAGLFNTAASTVTWTVPKNALDVTSIGAGVNDCDSLNGPPRGAPAVADGNILSRLVGTTGMSAGVGVVATLNTDNMNPALARDYTFGGQTSPLTVTVSDASGDVGAAIAISANIVGGTSPHACAWSGAGATFADAQLCATTVTYAASGSFTVRVDVSDAAGATAFATATVDVVDAATERVEILVDGVLRASTPVTTSQASPTAEWSVELDLSNAPAGPITITANWIDSDGATLATAARHVTVGSVGAAFVRIDAPVDGAQVSGDALVGGVAGHAEQGAQTLNAHGWPIASGFTRLKAETLEGSVLTPCPACQPMSPGEIPADAYDALVAGTAESNLATSSAWLGGPGGDTDGLDGQWFDITGLAGATYELSDEFDVAMDIVFFAAWEDLESLAWDAGEAMPKGGVVPPGANWAFVYLRRGTEETAPNQWGGAPVLTLTPQIVPPSVVQGLTATPGPGAVALAWSPPAANGGELLGYNVYRDGSFLLSTTARAYVDEPGDTVTHAYAVEAYNSAGAGPAAQASAAALSGTIPFAITTPADGATGVSPATSIAGTYDASGGSTGGGSGAFANTHYVYLLNLNDDCGDFLGYGDHRILDRLADHAVDVLGMPAANVHVYNEDGGPLTRSRDAANYDRLDAEWQTGAVFDGPANWNARGAFPGFASELARIAGTAADAEAAGGAPARIFFVESSHGILNPLLLGDGLTDSSFCLQDVSVTSTMLGDLLNSIDADVAAEHPAVAIEWSINVDCSFCGGFADSPLTAPGTTPVATAGVVGENRVVEVGCAWMTECTGNPATTYDYMFNLCTFTGKADGFGPLVVTGTQWNGADLGDEFLVADPAHHAKDGVITLEESYWCAMSEAHGSTDVWALEQEFQIVDNLYADMFQLDGFPIWDVNENLGLAAKDPATALGLLDLARPRATATDPAGDSPVPHADLVTLDARATTTDIVVKLGVADLTLSSAELEDVIEYDLYINGARYGACYSLGEVYLFGYDIPNTGPTGEPDPGARSEGSAVYDFEDDTILFTIPQYELPDRTLPAQVSAFSAGTECSTLALPVEYDQIPDVGTIGTSAGDDEVVEPGADRVIVELSGPNGAVVNGLATLDATAGTWTLDPAGDLAAGTWTVVATHEHAADGTTFAPVADDSVAFQVGSGADTQAPTAPTNLAVDGAPTATTVSLTWGAASDDTAVDRYTVYRDGGNVGTTASLAFTDSGLAPSTTYTYTVTASDAANNEGPASNAAQATTAAQTTPLGTVTLRAGAVVLGSATVDTSVVDPADWQVVVDTTQLADGVHDIVAEYDDGEGSLVTDTVRVTVSNALGIDITSPEDGAEVGPSFTVAGTTSGAGGASGIMASGFVRPDGTIDPTHAGYALATSGGLTALDAALTDAPGYLGVAPDVGGARVVRAYFEGSAPAMPQGALPAGWTLEVVENIQLQRAVKVVKDMPELPETRARTGPPVPGQAAAIGPGSHLLMKMKYAPGYTFACTANFVWKDVDTGDYYLGAAGHCFLPNPINGGPQDSRTSTHGAGADYDPADTTSIRVCVSNCQFGGQLGFAIIGNVVELVHANGTGGLAYARQTGSGGDVGNDFGLVKIPHWLVPLLRQEMPVWNGPTKEGTLSTGEPAVLYGNAAGFGEAWPTMARGGFGALSNANRWAAVLPSFQGDSGSALNNLVVTDPATTAVEGDEAIGILTHLALPGPVVGTTMARAKTLALDDADIRMTLVKRGDVISVTPPPPSVPGAPTLDTLTPGPTTMGLAWTAPASDGGSPITGYTIRYGTSPSALTQTLQIGAVTSATVEGLAEDTRYHFAVAATNAVGTGADSNVRDASTTRTVTVPDAPTNLAAAGGDALASLSWSAPANDGGASITSYTVHYGTTSGAYDGSKSVTGTSTVVTGLTNNQTYFFVVRAHNSQGTSAPSNEATATPQDAGTPAYTVQVRAPPFFEDWRAATAYDGSTFTFDIVGASAGALDVEARLMEDGNPTPLATDVVAVTVVVPNTPPTASLTAPASAAEGTNVLLDGSASSDADAGDTLTYAWTQLDGPSVTLDGAGDQRTFVAPQVSVDTDLRFRLSVTDAAGATSTAEATVEVRDLTTLVIDSVDGAPAQDGIEANGIVTLAGAAHVANSGTGGHTNTPPEADVSFTTSGATVTATSAASFDPDGAIVARGWALTLGSSTVATGVGESFSHTVAASGTYVLSLTVTDDDGANAQAQTPPFALVVPVTGGFVVDAGDSAFVELGDDVALSATAFGANGPVTYSWAIDGQTVANGQSVLLPTSTLSAGPLVVTVTATDGASSDTDDVKILLYELGVTTHVFAEDVLVGVNDEDGTQAGAGDTSGLVDDATFDFSVPVAATATKLDALLTWESYNDVIPPNPLVPGGGGPNDFDLYAYSPDGAQDKSSADFDRPEQLTVVSPNAGAWRLQVRSYVVVDDRFTLTVDVTQAPLDPRPVATQVTGVCILASDPTLEGAVSPGASGAWDADGDGTFETAGLTATAPFAAGTGLHFARFRATSDGYTDTLLVPYRIEQSCTGAPSLVVVGISDSGINPYHKDFAGELVPYPELREWTTADPQNLGPGDVELRHRITGELLPFTKHPSTYVPGFPADAEAIELTLGGGFYKSVDDARGIWNGHDVIKLNTWYWFPGTKIIAALDGSDTAAVNDLAGDQAPILDEGGHGTASASVAVGNMWGSCPRCLLAFAEGLSSDTWFFDQPWIDFVSVSGGSVANIGVPDGGLFGFEDATRAAAERGQTLSYAAGNGVDLSFLTPEQTYLSNSLGPDWTIAVGAVAKGSGSVVHGTGKPVDWSSYGSGSIAASCTNNYQGNCGHSGTSSATPIATGHMANVLLDARIALGDAQAGQKTPAQAGGTRQAIAVGSAGASSWLADGVLTRAELWNVMFHCASGFGSSTGFPGSLPASPVDYAYGGYGIADVPAETCARNALLNGGAIRSTPDADQFFEVDEAIRDALWGDWDGDGDGQPGGNHNTASGTAAPVPAPVGLTFADVDTVDEVTRLLRDLAASVGLSSETLPVTETYYLHQNGCGAGQDNTPYADRTPAAAEEGGHGCGGVATNEATTWTSRVPTGDAFAAGAIVTARVKAFTLVPTTGVVLTGTLFADGVPVGQGASPATDSVSLALVTTPCTEFVITFATTGAIAAGAELALQVTSELGTGDIIVCYEGGTDASRFVVDGASGTTEPPALTATITSPAQGAEVSGASATISGTASFPPQEATQRLWLGRASCGTADDGLKLTPGAAQVGSGANGCAFIQGATAPVQGQFIETYPLVQAELPLALVQGGIVSGAIAFGTQGVDPAKVKLSLVTSAGVAGSVTKDVLVVGSDITESQVTVEFEFAVADAVANVELSSLALEIQILQQGAIHWTELENPPGYVDIPRAVATGGSVEVAIDDPTFGAASRLAVTGSESWSATWSLDGVAPGEHTIYARAVSGADVGPADSVVVTVAGQTGTTGSGRVELAFTQGAAPAADAWTRAAFDPATGAWSFDWDTLDLANGDWNAHARLVDDAGQTLLTEAVIVRLVNDRAPTLAPIGDVTVAEGDTLAFAVEASDLDGDTLAFALDDAASTGATLDAATGAFGWTPSFTQAGLYQFTVTVSDGTGNSASDTFQATVLNVNRAPTLDAVPDATVAENATLAFALSATDVDTDDTLTYGASGLPADATLDAATGAFSWTPTFDDAGVYAATFTVTDGHDTAARNATITVTNVNRAPTLNHIADRTVPENAPLVVQMRADDADGDAPALSVAGLPAGATFTDAGDGSARLEWVPTYTQAGTYTLDVTATDDEGATDAQSFTITVTNVNRRPNVDGVPAPRSVNVGELVAFDVVVSDPDPEDTATLTVENLPDGATFTNGAFAWRPDVDQTGVFEVFFNATDGDLTTERVATLAVNALPQMAINARTGIPYATLPAALAAAVDGDVIRLTPGEYGTATVRLNDTIICAADGDACATGPVPGVVIRDGLKVIGDRVTIQGVNLTGTPPGSGGPAALVHADMAPGLVVRDSLLSHTQLMAISLYGSDGARIENNVFAPENPVQAVILAHSSSPDVVIRGNVFDGCQSCISIASDTSPRTLVEDNAFLVEAPSQPTTGEVRAVSLRGEGPTSRNNTFTAGTAGSSVVALTFTSATGASSLGDTFDGVHTGVRIVESAGNVVRDATFATTLYPIDVAGTTSPVDARLNDWGVYQEALLPARVRQPSDAEPVTVLQVPFRLMDGSQEPPAPKNTGAASHTDGDAAACESLDSDGDGFADAYHDGARCNYLTVGAAILGAHAGQTILVPASQTTPATARVESLVIDRNSEGEALDGLTLCGSTDGATCATGAADGRVVIEGAGDAPVLSVRAAGVTVSGLTLRRASDGPGAGVEITGADATLADNAITGPNDAPAQAAGQTGIELSAGADGFALARNALEGWGNIGIYVGGSAGAGAITDNVVKGTGNHALLIEGVGGGAAKALAVTGNDLRGAGSTNLRLDTDRPMQVRDNLLGLAPETVAFTTRVAGYTLDARGNDWGAYGRDVIPQTFGDIGTNDVRHMPYLDANGAHHPALVLARCQERADGSTGSVHRNDASYLDLQDALDQHACPAGTPVVQLNLAADAEAYDGATIRRTAVVDAATGARILAPGYGAPGLTIVSGSGRTFVEGATFDVAAGATGILVSGLLQDEFAYIYQNTFVGEAGGTGVRAEDGRGVGVQFNRFVGLNAAAVFEDTTGGSVWSNEIVDGPKGGAYAEASVVLRRTADAQVRANHIVVDQAARQNLYAVNVNDSANALVLGNAILGNAQPGSIAIVVRNSDDAIVADNLVQKSNLGVYVRDSADALIRANRIVAPPESQTGTPSTGGISAFLGSDHVIDGNTVVGAATAVSVRGTPGVRIEGLVAHDVATGVSIDADSFTNAQPTGIQVNNATLAGTGIALALGSSTLALAVDAECNDWGAYNAATIPTRIKDDGYFNSVDYQPYTSLDSGASLACLRVPVASFDASPNPASRGVDVSFTDESVAGSRPIIAWAWEFGDGATSADQNPTHAYDSVGTWLVKLTVTDLDGMQSTHLAELVVQNAAPVLDPISNVTVAEGALASFTVSATDADGDALAYSAAPLPPGAAFDTQTGAFSWRPASNQAGVYAMTIGASDGELADEASVTITVHDLNRAPTLAPLGPFSVHEGASLEFAVVGSDPDGDDLTYSAQPMPAGATLDGVTGAFAWTPGYDAAGTHVVTFAASDGIETATRDVTITVTNVQRPPVFDTIPSRTVFEGEALTLDVRATDPEGDALTLGISNLPDGASFADHGDGTGTLSWTPTQFQSGDYTLDVRASDGTAIGSTTALLRVADVNAGPAFVPVGSKRVSEGARLAFIVAASDPEGDPLSYAVEGLPAGATFNGATRVFDWRPSYDQAGLHQVTFSATDGADTARELVNITVVNVNRAPVVDDPGTVATVAKRAMLLDDVFSDPDGDAITRTASGLPEGAAYNAATGAFTWTPEPHQVGEHNVTLRATDGKLATLHTLRLRVDPNRAPDLAILPAPTDAEAGEPVALRAIASDPDGGHVLIEWDFDGVDPAFTPHAAGPNATHAFPDAGVYVVTARATDAEGYATLAQVTVLVDDALVMTLTVSSERVGATESAAGAVTLRWTNGTALAGTRVLIQVYWAPVAAGEPALVREMGVTIREDGSATFVVPKDTALANHQGTHLVRGSVVVPQSVGGDSEAAAASDTYVVGL